MGDDRSFKDWLNIRKAKAWSPKHASEKENNKIYENLEANAVNPHFVKSLLRNSYNVTEWEVLALLILTQEHTLNCFTNIFCAFFWRIVAFASTFSTFVSVYLMFFPPHAHILCTLHIRELEIATWLEGSRFVCSLC